MNIAIHEVAQTVDNTSERVIKLSKDLRDLLHKGGFRSTKWLSNNRNVLENIPEREGAKSVVNFGMKWNAETDNFIWELREETKTLAKHKASMRRRILSKNIHSLIPLVLFRPMYDESKLNCRYLELC